MEGERETDYNFDMDQDSSKWLPVLFGDEKGGERRGIAQTRLVQDRQSEQPKEGKLVLPFVHGTEVIRSNPSIITSSSISSHISSILPQKKSSSW